MDLSAASALLNNPAAKMEQASVVAAMGHARLLREGNLAFELEDSPQGALDRVKALHAAGHCVWGPPQYTGGDWVIWHFKKKEG